jgi:hypothetical protein
MSPTTATGQPREVFLVVPDRKEIEQALRRVRVATVAGVDHVLVRLHAARNQERRAARSVAHDEHVGMHRREVRDRIEQRLALGLRGHRDIEVDDVGRESLRGDLEGRAGARGSLEEQVEYALAAQQRHFLDVALGDADKGLGGVENLQQDFPRQAFNG